MTPDPKGRDDRPAPAPEGGRVATPAEVLEADLTRNEKVRLLQQMELDARQLQVARGEGMTGPSHLPDLPTIQAALRKLGVAEPSAE